MAIRRTLNNTTARFRFSIYQKEKSATPSKVCYATDEAAKYFKRIKRRFPGACIQVVHLPSMLQLKTDSMEHFYSLRKDLLKKLGDWLE